MPPEPSVKRAVAFFDVQNLYRHAKAAFGHHHPNFDPVKLHRAVCLEKGWEPASVRFYTGIPSVTEDPPWHGYWANRLLALKRAGVITITRDIRYRKTQVTQNDGTVRTVTTPQEKGIDVRLAIDLVSLARKREFDVALIFSQDQDLSEIMDEIKEIALEQSRWMRIACAFPSGPSATARRGINGTDWVKMDELFYNACIDQRDYRPKAK